MDQIQQKGNTDLKFMALQKKCLLLSPQWSTAIVFLLYTQFKKSQCTSSHLTCRFLDELIADYSLLL